MSMFIRKNYFPTEQGARYAQHLHGLTAQLATNKHVSGFKPHLNRKMNNVFPRGKVLRRLHKLAERTTGVKAATDAKSAMKAQSTPGCLPRQ